MIEEIRKFIKEDEIEKAFSALESHCEDREVLDYIYLLSNQYQNWMKNDLVGLKPENYIRQRIIFALLKIVSEVEIKLHPKRKDSNFVERREKTEDLILDTTDIIGKIIRSSNEDYMLLENLQRVSPNGYLSLLRKSQGVKIASIKSKNEKSDYETKKDELLKNAENLVNTLLSDPMLDEKQKDLTKRFLKEINKDEMIILNKRVKRINQISFVNFLHGKLRQYIGIYKKHYLKGTITFLGGVISGYFLAIKSLEDWRDDYNNSGFDSNGYSPDGIDIHGFQDSGININGFKIDGENAIEIIQTQGTFSPGLYYLEHQPEIFSIDEPIEVLNSLQLSDLF